MARVGAPPLEAAGASGATEPAPSAKLALEAVGRVRSRATQRTDRTGHPPVARAMPPTPEPTAVSRRPPAAPRLSSGGATAGRRSAPRRYRRAAARGDGACTAGTDGRRPARPVPTAAPAPSCGPPETRPLAMPGPKMPESQQRQRSERRSPWPGRSTAARRRIPP